ncbi:MAG: exosortase system-associated protein, TIGR04073 family [Candidatus Omnitrophota bacterium]
MKKVIALICLTGVLLACSPLYADSPLKKLGRGTANIITCPAEIFQRVDEVNKDSGPLAALTWGLAKGLYRTVVRGAVGVYEVISFPFPFPAEYKPIITDPEFYMEEGLN